MIIYNLNGYIMGYSHTLRKYSNPIIAQKQAYKYLGKTAKLYPADKKGKKYKVYDKKIKSGLISDNLVMRILLSIRIKQDVRITLLVVKE